MLIQNLDISTDLDSLCLNFLTINLLKTSSLKLLNKTVWRLLRGQDNQLVQIEVVNWYSSMNICNAFISFLNLFLLYFITIINNIVTITDNVLRIIFMGGVQFIKICSLLNCFNLDISNPIK